MEALLRLFKAVEVESKEGKRVSMAVMNRTLRSGFVFSPEVAYNYTDRQLDDIVEWVENHLTLTPEQMNNAFHKSWQKIKEADLEQLVVEQLAHYMTTYGKEAPEKYLKEKRVQWGVDGLSEKVSALPDIEMDKAKDEDYVYVPKEALEIPELDVDGLRIMVIRGYKKDEIKEKLLNLLRTGIALHEDTVADVVEVAIDVEIGQENVDDIKNKEVKTALCDYLGLFPENPTEFLRYVIFKAINSTLLIKNPATIEMLKTADLKRAVGLFKDYKKRYGLERFGEIFLRFKPLFLAMKSEKRMRPIVNKIRKHAVRHHKPMKRDLLNDVTGMLKRGEGIPLDVFRRQLADANPFRKIRLAYALKYRTKDVGSILYRIRNGKAFACEFDFDRKVQARAVLKHVLCSLTQGIRPNVEGKKIFIPEHIRYALPATEKQFTGDLPSGTCVTVPKDMVFGIHWNNVDRHRIDLDLSLMNAEVGKIGWDARFRDEGKNILFSGDVTDARGKNGASELFYIKRQAKQSFIMHVNYYNFRESVEVPFRILVAHEQVKNLKQNYMVDPNNVLSVANTKINVKQKILGLLVTTTEECRFYFCESAMGRGITSTLTDHAEHSRRYLASFYQNAISLNELLEKAGAEMVKEREGCDIDLSPEVLEKDKIIGLLA